jgi:hypothetical protein
VYASCRGGHWYHPAAAATLGGMNERIAVMGASGHTGRFVVAELARRGLQPVPCGRRTDLDQALTGAGAVINCAGPFAATARPVIEAAVRARIPYFDVTAEIEAVADAFATYADAGILVVPSVGFYGGLGDLLATAAMGDWPAADRITIAYALSGWRPTPGTRATGQVSARRRDGRRVLFTDHRLQFRTGDAPRSEWTFPPPIGRQVVVGEFTMADSATIPTHLKTPDIFTYMTANAVDDLHAPDPSGPVAVDEFGRSAQRFTVEVVVHAAGAERRATASGRDIYAVTAPLVVEAAQRALNGDVPTGVFSVGALFDARDFLAALTPEHLTLG